MGVKGDLSIWEAESFGTELWNITIGDLLDRQAGLFADKEALVYNYPEIGLNLRLTYRQYRDEVNRLAKGLIALGIGKGEHVAIWAHNVPEWLFLQLATAKIGAVLVTVNTAYRAAELEYLLRQGDVTTMFMVEEVRGNSFVESLYSVAPEFKTLADPIAEVITSEKLPRLKRAVLIGRNEKHGLLPYSKVIELGQGVTDETLHERQAQVTPQDIAQVQYTSGTTGFPKGAMMTHYSQVNNGKMTGDRNGSILENPADMRLVLPMPLFHVGGCILGALNCITKGATLIQMLGFDPAKQLELISTERATHSSGVPTMLVALVNHPKLQTGELETSHLRLVTSGGSPVPVALMEQVKQKLGADSSIVFGMTEANGSVTLTLPEDSFELKSATVGLALPNVSLKIVRPGSNEPVPIGETGELLIKGFLLMVGYYNMPDRTATALDGEGWLHSGDLATMNAQGYVNIVGRVKDMIIRGGENMYPAEIEAFLMRHPKIAEAQVVGVPDPFMGEELVALLRAKPGETPTEEEVRDFCKATISRNKVPRYIRFVNEYPTTVSGKVKKFELKSGLIKELGLEELSNVRTA